MSTSEPGHHWTPRQRPLRLERRLEFDDYEQTRDFLERVGELSEAQNIYPNLSFGRTYVNLTLFAEEPNTELSPEQLRFAGALDQLLDSESLEHKS